MRSPLFLVVSLAAACGQNASSPTPSMPVAPGVASSPSIAPGVASSPPIAPVTSIERPGDDSQCVMLADKDPCYRGIEAMVFGQLPGRAARNGTRLTLVLDDGRTVEKLSSRSDEASTVYDLLDFRGGFFMIHVRRHEGADWLAVSAATGQERSWSRVLAFAPDAHHLAVAAEKDPYEEELEALRIWEITGRGVATQVGSVSPSCSRYAFQWQGSDTILVTTNAEACGAATTTQVRRGSSGRWEAAN